MENKQSGIFFSNYPIQSMSSIKAFLIFSLICFTTNFLIFAQTNKPDSNLFVTYIVDAKKQEIKLYWKDEQQRNFKSIERLKLWLDKNHQQLLFAMNAGMYRTDYSPSGLFIENGKLIRGLNKANGSGNFFLKPNGVFYITNDNVPFVCVTNNFINDGKVKYAIQSGPMLVVNGQISTAFKANSINVNIRNGVGILPNNQVVFAMSKTAINFYDFANYFKSLGCKNALYLDGFVSRTYLPEKKWIQMDGDFGVMIGVSKMK